MESKRPFKTSLLIIALLCLGHSVLSFSPSLKKHKVSAQTSDSAVKVTSELRSGKQPSSFIEQIKYEVSVLKRGRKKQEVSKIHYNYFKLYTHKYFKKYKIGELKSSLYSESILLLICKLTI